MNYFDYNEYRSRKRANARRRLEALVHPKEGSIVVHEDPKLSVDDIREYIKAMNESTPESPTDITGTRTT